VTVNNAHAATAKLFDDAVVRDGLPDHWRESYFCKTSKSMKALDLTSRLAVAIASRRVHCHPPDPRSKVKVCTGHINPRTGGIIHCGSTSMT